MADAAAGVAAAVLGAALIGPSPDASAADVTFERLLNPEPQNWLMNHHDFSSQRFSPLEMLRVLDRHAVAFVLIGGVAARLHGSPSLTGDLDLCYDRRPENLERLARTS